MERNHFLVTLALYGRRARRLVARTTFAQLQTHPLCESRGRDQKRARELTLLLKRASRTLILLEKRGRGGGHFPSVPFFEDMLGRDSVVTPILLGRSGSHSPSKLLRLLYYYYRNALIQAKDKRLVGERNPPPILTPC